MKIAEYFKKSTYFLCCLVLSLSALGFLANSQRTNAAPIVKIAFSSDRDGNNEIYTMNSDGSNLVNVTNNAAADLYADWSPDGSKIAFYTNRDGNYEVYAMYADGSNVARLTNNAASDLLPDWSPDGSKIAFASFRDGNYEVYTANSDGSSQVNVTNNAASDTFPSWSPDGSKIAFVSFRDGNNEIYTMNADGSNLVRLTNNTSSELSPNWSPDGSKIVFYTTRDGNNEIYTMNSDGSNQVNVTNNAASDTAPSYGLIGDTTIPNNGDANGDGVFDVLQANVSSVVNPVTGAYAVVELDSVCTTSSFSMAAEVDNSDPGFSYPGGLMEFNADCGTLGYTTTVTQYYYGLADGDYTLRKYIPANSAYFTIDGASSISLQTIGGESVTVVSYQVADGGSLDVDGVADGMIMDPAGLGQSVVSAPNTGLGFSSL